MGELVERCPGRVQRPGNGVRADGAQHTLLVVPAGWIEQSRVDTSTSG